jgi:hypothetical protein
MTLLLTACSQAGARLQQATTAARGVVRRLDLLEFPSLCSKMTYQMSRVLERFRVVSSDVAGWVN